MEVCAFISTSSNNLQQVLALLFPKNFIRDFYMLFWCYRRNQGAGTSTKLHSSLESPPFFSCLCTKTTNKHAFSHEFTLDSNREFYLPTESLGESVFVT